MTNLQIAYIALMCGAVVIACICIAVNILSRRKDQPPDYDERQKIVQGKANGYAYGTLVLSLGIYLLYDYIAEKPVLNAPIAIILCVMVSYMVYTVTCIIKESFVSLSDPRSDHAISDLFLGICFIGQGVMRIIDGTIIKDGVLQFPILILAFGVVYMAQTCAFIIRNAIHKKEAAQESCDDE